MTSPYLDFVVKKWRIKLQSWRDDRALRKDTLYFRPSGTQIYVGRQGSGKTISAVEHLLDVKDRYPKCIVVTNLEMKHLVPRRFNTKDELDEILSNQATPFNPQTECIFVEDVEQLALALVGVNNGKLGVYYLLDEIHLYFNSIESKNIPMFVFTEISQQRKQRKLIVGTSQLYTRLAKPFREQCDNMIMCKTYFGVFTLQFTFDGMSLPEDFDNKIDPFKAEKIGFFWHTRRTRNSYDTFQKVVSALEQYETGTSLKITKDKRGRLFEK